MYCIKLHISFDCGVQIKLPLKVAVDDGDKGPRAGD